MPRCLTQTVGSRWMGVQNGDDKKQPLRRDGITTIQRATFARLHPLLSLTHSLSLSLSVSLDFILISPCIIVPLTRLCRNCFVSIHVMSFRECTCKS